MKKILRSNTRGFLLLLTLIIAPIIFAMMPLSNENLRYSENLNQNVEHNEILDGLEPSVGFSNYQWWNDTWEYRISVNVSANGAEQNNVPIELEMNFTSYLKEMDLENSEFDKDSIRVIEYKGISDWIEIPCQFDEYDTTYITYDNKTNAIGDLIWIMNGTTGASTTRNYLIYFNNNETTEKAPKPNYSTIRQWHEGFEGLDKATSGVLSAAGSQDVQPNNWDVSSSVSARGNHSLNIWGNCWKAIDPTGSIISITPNTYVTVKMRIDDPSILRDISGIGFQRNGYLTSLPSQSDTYEMRGWQNWGFADAPAPYGPYDDNYYAEDMFFWYTLNLDDEISRNDFRYIFFVADDDSPDSLNVYWDDISLWNQAVQTDPSHLPLVTLGEIEPIAYSLKITCVDLDGFRVPGAHVYITNGSQPFLDKDDETNQDGEVFYNNVSREGVYNITVEYTQHGDGNTEIVYFEENYQLTTLSNEKEVRLNLWTINFDISDADGEEMENCYVLLINNTDVVGNETLVNGLATIRWINQTEYNYSVYYDYPSLKDGSTYNPSHLLIYNGTVNRASSGSPEYLSQSEVIDDEAERISGGVTDDVRAVVTFTPQKGKNFSEFNITARDADDYIISFEVEVLVAQTWTKIHTYHDNGDELSTYSIEYNYTDASQIKVTMIKENYIEDNGTIDLLAVESTDVIFSTKVSKTVFNITDSALEELENAILYIFNQSGGLTTTVSTLKIDEEGFATFFGFNNETKNWGNYSLIIEFAGSNRPFGTPGVWEYSENSPFNFSFDTKVNISLAVNLNLEWYVTNLTLENQYPLNFLTDIYWRDNVSIEFKFWTNDTTDLNPAQESDPDSVFLQFLDEDFGVYSTPIDLSSFKINTGEFNFTFNSSDYSLKGGNIYYMRITATKSGYTNPDPILKRLDVHAVLTEYTVIDPTTLVEISSYTLTKYWNTTTTLALFINETISGEPVAGAILTYNWEYGSGLVSEDPTKGAGYYNFTIDTGIATDTKTEIITFSFTKTNFDTPTGRTLRIDVNERPTSLNESTSVSYFSEDLYIGDAENYTFYYKDVLTGNPIENVDQKSYTWQKLDSDGNPIEGENGVGTLIEKADGSYVMDLNTENFQVGYYFIFLTIEKDFHEEKDGILILEVMKRVIGTDFSANFDIKDSKIEVIKGETIEFKLELFDETQDNIPLIGATVSLTIGSEKFKFDEKDDGTYVLTFSTAEYDALFTSQTLTGKITIEKTDYEDKTIELTIVVNMEEVFPGVPASYFYIIVGAIVAVVGTLVIYNAIQKAKIPKFVKKVRAMKKAIESRKDISADLLYPLKHEAMVKEFGNLWEELGLSLGDILGVQRKKGKTPKTPEGGNQ